MAGTVKLCVPELVFVVRNSSFVDLFGAHGSHGGDGRISGTVRVGRRVAGVADDAGVFVSADVGDAPGVEDKAAAEPPEAAADATAEEFDPLAPHAVRPAPPMTAAMITAGTRHILMLLPSGK